MAPHASKLVATTTQTRPRPLSAIDIAILTLSDNETTSRRWLRDLEIVPEHVAEPQSIRQLEDIPLPLFASKKMIDRDAARINACKTSTIRPDYHTTFKQAPLDHDVEEFWRFKNTCERIDAEPRTADRPPGVFTDAELAMFDPVFQDFILDCYKHGIPGHKKSPPHGLEVLESPHGRDNGDNGTPPGCNGGPVSYPPEEQETSDTLSAVDKASGPYWNLDTWKAWVEDVAVEVTAPPPPTLCATGNGYFKGFIGVRPSRLQSSKHSAFIATKSPMKGDTGNGNAEWWLSDEWLQDNFAAAGPTRTAASRVQAASSKSIAVNGTMDPDGQQFPTLRNSWVIHLDRTQAVQGKYVPSSSGSSDVSVTFSPLPVTLRTAVGSKQAMEFVEQSTKSLLTKPSNWVVKRIEKLRGAKRA